MKQNKQWELIFNKISKKKDFTFEGITIIYIVLYLVKNEKINLLYQLNQNSNLAVFKNNKRIFGNLEFDPIILKNIRITTDDKNCPQQLINIFENYIKNGDNEFFRVLMNDYLIIYKIDKKILLKESEKEKKSIFNQQVIIFLCSMISWIIFIGFIFDFNMKKIRDRKLVIMVLFGIFVSFFNSQYVKDFGNYEEEMNKKIKLNNVVIGIASTSIGLSFILLFVENFREIDLFMRFIMFSFIFCISSLLIPTLNKTSFSIHRSNMIQRSMINLSITSLLVGIIIYLHHSFNKYL